ncbi:MAG: bifunctional oligoribonuclease/PAP phosphatase NrnA [Candidatus Rokubacteria bacterium]|nr:bifunctional oligoribonuclease/PAP phosphatase NrnA [Candidatus Rokubacteria bacterium]
MRRVVVCPTDFLFELLQGPGAPAEPTLFIVADPRTRSRLARRDAQALAGRLEDPALYRRAQLTPGDQVLLMAAPREPEPILDAILDAAPGVPVLLVQKAPEAPALLRYPTVTTLALPRLLREVLRPELDRASLHVRAERIRKLLDGKERVGILLQDDPDPDALASGLALRALLGRTKPTAPLISFGRITRPENVAMVRAIEIEVERITPADLERYDALAIVDAQPPFFEEALPEIAVVIDHHPEAKGWRSAFRDVRASYGATATILTEYLRAAEVKITERVATALLYGIKSDTLHLERGGIRADMEAFAYLYELANHNTLRRIERPELPQGALDALGDALLNRQVIRNALFAHLGPVSRPDLIPQFADLCLQVAGIEWSVVSGITGDELHISVRNVGYVRAAGEVVTAAFGDLGSAGGHRSAAKAVISLRRWAAEVSPIEPAPLREAIAWRFVRALEGVAGDQ